MQRRGIEDFHFHDLRHTFATRLGDAECNATTIARLLGHSNIQMSMRYTPASDASLRSAVEYAATKMPQGTKKPLMRVAVNT
jgi:integrase